MRQAYEDLVNAIILQAVKDYCTYAKKVKKQPANIYATRMVSDVERFFRSGWFTFLSDLDGEWIIERLKKWVL